MGSVENPGVARVTEGPITVDMTWGCEASNSEYSPPPPLWGWVPQRITPMKGSDLWGWVPKSIMGPLGTLNEGQHLENPPLHEFTCQ